MSSWLVPHKAMGLLDLIEQCPDACRWREAAANDFEYLRWEREHSPNVQASKSWSPRLAEFDLSAYLLVQLVNLVGVLASGKNVKKYTPLTGPQTAHDKADKVSEATGLSHLFSALTPS